MNPDVRRSPASFSGKILVLIVESYPFEFGEAFLEEELMALPEYFSKLLIVIPDSSSVNTSVQRYKLPVNCELVLIDNKIKPWHKAAALANIFSLRILRHLLFIKTRFGLNPGRGVLGSVYGYEAACQSFSRKLLRELKKRKIPFENLYLYTYWLTEYSYCIARIRSSHPELRAISRVHGWDLYFERHQPPYLPLREYIAKNLNRVITVSDNGKYYLLNKIREADRDKIVTHRLGCNPGSVKNYSWTGKLLLLSISSLKPVKQIELLIDALSMINLPVEWNHIGGHVNNNTEYVMSLAKRARKNLSQKPNISFTFHGMLSKEELYNFMETRNIDLLVNTSRSEGLPVSIMEAMAHGIPAMAPGVGGIPEIIENEVNGFLLSSSPMAEEVAEKLHTYALLHPDNKNRLRQNAYKTWKEKFDAANNHRKFAEEISSL